MNVASELSTKYFRSGTISTLNEVVIYCMLTEEKSPLWQDKQTGDGFFNR